MNVTIREATAQDYDPLCAIIDEVDDLHRRNLPQRFQPPAAGSVRSRHFIVSAIEDPETGLFVAEVEDRLAGMVHVIVRETPDIPIMVPRRYACVDSLAVSEPFRRMGIGRALMEKARAWARAQGASSIELNVYAFNRTALAFYRALGYEFISHYLGQPLT